MAGAAGGAGQTGLARGLVGYWAFDEGSGTTARDGSGRGNHGTLIGFSGAAWVPGRTGGYAVDFGDGATATRVEVPDSASIDGILTGITIAAWVWPSAEPTQRWRSVLSRQAGPGSNAEHFGLGFLEDFLGLFLTAEMDMAGPGFVVSLPLATWTHLAGTYDGQVGKLFIDGKEVATKQVMTKSLAAASTPVAIGNNRNEAGFQEGWMGKLDDVVLYDRALAADEIAALARGQVPK